MSDHQVQRLLIETVPGDGYVLSGKIMLSAIVLLFAFVVFLVGLHLYARWYLLRMRRRQLEHRRQRRANRSRILHFADSRHPRSAVDGGLEQAVLNSLPVFLYSSKLELSSTECAVCLSEFEEKEIVRLLPKCNHSFHIDCIDMWFHSHSTCPICRSPVEKVERQLFTAVEKGDTSETGCSSDSGLRATCQQEEVNGDGSPASVGGQRKALELQVRIEVPPRRAESENELNLNSPVSRLLYFKRILSMGKKSPSGGGQATPRETGPSGGASVVELESGPSEARGDATPAQTSR